MSAADRPGDRPMAPAVPPTGALPVAPSLAWTQPPRRVLLVDGGVLRICVAAVVVAALATGAAEVLRALIAAVTNLAFFGRFSIAEASPAAHGLGAFVIGVPIAGGLLVGIIARFGSAAVRGHGIPEAMEQVLLNESRIPPRIVFLKPISAAFAIGTGGPFGAEGPIIATGGALGSLVGQLLVTTAGERKALLAAGAAAGMTATFGTPVAAILLAIELLLFELRPRSVVPVTLACVTAAGLRSMSGHAVPVFPMPAFPPVAGTALMGYGLIGTVVGLASVVITRAVYAVEDAFAELPIHWMWWPALGGVVVGLVGWMAPRTLGVGYDNITAMLAGDVAGQTLLVFAGLKLLSWAIALGSGTSGGTLAPLFTVGGGLGALLAAAAGFDPRVGALVGMASMFAGASRAFLASVVFAFETTLQPAGILPLLAGCAGAYVVSGLLMPTTIMTEKIVRRGVRVPDEYAADFLDQVTVREQASRPPVTLQADARLGAVRGFVATATAEARHQGFPVVDADGRLIGVLTRRDLLDPAVADDRRVADLIHRPPVVAWEHMSLRDAADVMAREGIGRLPVVAREAPQVVSGMLTRSDLLAAHRRRLDESSHATRGLGPRREGRVAS